MRLVTERLILRPFEEEDLEVLQEIRSDPEVGRYSHFHSNIEETRQWLQDVLDYDRRHAGRQDADRAFNFAIAVKEEGALIGWIGIGRPSRPSPPGELDFGYALNRRFWGQGYMTEAIRALLAFGFESLGARHIYAECQPPNVASARVMEKAGLRYEGIHSSDGVVHLRFGIDSEQWSAIH